jgi:hypothetical protein
MPHLKWQQAGHPLQGAFRKKQRSIAGPGDFGNSVGVFHAFGRIEPLDKKSLQPASNVRAKNRWASSALATKRTGAGRTAARMRLSR